MFFLTYGIYSVVSSVLLHVFRSSFAGNVSLSAGVVMTVASLPMLFSRDNITEALYSSRTGSSLCECIGVRMVTLVQKQRTGHMNQGFAMGVVAGTVSIALSTRSILSAMLVVTVCCVTFALPSAGIMFCAAAFLFSEDRLMVIVCLCTMLAYLIKLMRGKRSAAFHVSGVIFLIFTVIVGVRVLFSRDALDASCWKYVIFLASYFLFCFILRNCRSSVRAMIIMSLSCGALSVLYCLGYGVDVICSLILPDKSIDGGFILNTVLSLRIFSGGAASVAVGTLIPLTVGMALRSDHGVPRVLLWFCFITDVTFLAVTDSASVLVLALAATFILLLIYGKKWVYISLAAAVPAALAGAMFTGVGKALTASVYERLSDTLSGYGSFLGSLPELSASRLIFGVGSVFTDGNENFYSHLIMSFGIIAFLFFLAFIAVTLGFSIRFIIKTVGIDKNRDAFDRFDSVKSAADTRLGCISPLLSALVLLIFGLFYDLFDCGVLFMLLWALFGICSSYRRNALKEMDKAQSAESYTASRRNAEIMIRF
ncbi:MAG: hypothetical protein PUC29_06870 [Clostridia bacterium]|nr:hypothetical protein [Clostridia bacterium]